MKIASRLSNSLKQFPITHKKMQSIFEPVLNGCTNLLAFCSQHFFLYALRNLFIFLEEHGIITASLRFGT